MSADQPNRTRRTRAVKSLPAPPTTGEQLERRETETLAALGRITYDPATDTYAIGEES